MPIIVVLAASGNVGAIVTEMLIGSVLAGLDGEIRLISRSRDVLNRLLSSNPQYASNASTLERSIVTITSDITNPHTLEESLSGADRVFFCMPQSLSASDMVRVSNDFTDVAKKCGINTVVRISSYGIDAFQNGGMTQGPLGEAHAEGEKYMRMHIKHVTSIRPSSFMSNFITYDLENIRQNSKFASPLGMGHNAFVNWVSCSDIAKVAHRALVDHSFDGLTLNVTGPPSSTLNATAMMSLLTSKCGRTIEYVETELPPIEDYRALWLFLRAGGFNVCNDVVKDVTGDEPVDFGDWLNTLDLSSR